MDSMACAAALRQSQDFDRRCGSIFLRNSGHQLGELEREDSRTLSNPRNQSCHFTPFAIDTSPLSSSSTCASR
jgi:hypothetical protein